MPPNRPLMPKVPEIGFISDEEENMCQSVDEMKGTQRWREMERWRDGKMERWIYFNELSRLITHLI